MQTQDNPKSSMQEENSDTGPKEAPKEIVKEITGDLFDAPPGSALIRKLAPQYSRDQAHWVHRRVQHQRPLGKGHCPEIPRKGMLLFYHGLQVLLLNDMTYGQYPNAYNFYEQYCRLFAQAHARRNANPEAQDGRTLPADCPLGTALIIPARLMDCRDGRPAHWIICLFTSADYGQRADSTDKILENTRRALQDLKRKLQIMKRIYQNHDVPAPGELFACRFNSGLFGVPWAQTRQLVEEVGLEMTVVHPE